MISIIGRARRSCSRPARLPRKDTEILESTFVWSTAAARKFSTITSYRARGSGKSGLRSDGRLIGANLPLSWRKRRRLGVCGERYLGRVTFEQRFADQILRAGKLLTDAHRRKLLAKGDLSQCNR